MKKHLLIPANLREYAYKIFGKHPHSHYFSDTISEDTKRKRDIERAVHLIKAEYFNAISEVIANEADYYNSNPTRMIDDISRLLENAHTNIRAARVRECYKYRGEHHCENCIKHNKTERIKFCKLANTGWKS